MYLAHQKPESKDMKIVINGATLSSTSWTTAGATGALSYIDYAEAKKFASAYEIQAFLQRTLEEQIHASQEFFAILSFGGSPEKLSDDQLRTLEHDVLNLLSTITLWDQLAAQLSQQYERVLKVP